VRIEILCIGDELLDGRIHDLNASWFGRELAQRGLLLSQVSFVGDSEREILAAFAQTSHRCDYLLVSGGLGPTEDDRTRAAAAAFFETPLEHDEADFQRIVERYARLGRRVPSANRRQALFPVGATVLGNQVGTASGFRFTFNDCTLDFVPGVPREFRWFAEEHALPFLGPSRAVTQRSWTFFGLGESDIAEQLSDLELGNLSLHYEAKFPFIHILVRSEEADASNSVSAAAREIEARLGSYLVAEGKQSPIERLADGLVERGWTIATAESCTGGQVAQTLTSISGSSAYFREGFVTYSNKSKASRLGVRQETLQRVGAVAPETAREMAVGAQRTTGSELAIAVTGIAGPSGGTADKPVGTVYVAIAHPEGGWVRKLSLGPRPRNDIQTLTTWSALSMVLWYLEQRMPDGLGRPF